MGLCAIDFVGQTYRAVHDGDWQREAPFRVITRSARDASYLLSSMCLARIFYVLCISEIRKREGRDADRGDYRDPPTK